MSYIYNNGFIFRPKVLVDKILNKTSLRPIANKAVAEAIENVESKLVQSHVGMIIQSTTLDTMEKVIAIYGGTEWTKIEGRMLIGASTNYAVNSTGGSATHAITTSEMPSHAHSVNAVATGTISADHGHSGVAYEAGNHSHDANYGIQTSASGGFSYLGVSYGSGNAFWGGPVSVGAGGSHTHSIGTYGVNTNHTHILPAHNTNANGSGTAMNIMNPYKAVYIWERTA